jgi:rhodanese-related sulfurtransferase
MKKNTSPQRIAIPDLQMKMESAGKILIVDVRSSKEIQETGAVPDAVHVPIGEIAQHLEQFPKSGAIALYCGGGGRASRAAQTLCDAGHSDVFFFGIRDWKQRNLPTVKTAKPL